MSEDIEAFGADDPVVREFDHYVKRAVEQGVLFAIRGFMVQAQRSPMMWSTHDDIHVTTGVIFAFMGQSKEEYGVAAFCIDVDKIDAFCTALQHAKQDPVVPDGPDTIDYQIRNNNIGESNNE